MLCLCGKEQRLRSDNLREVFLITKAARRRVEAIKLVIVLEAMLKRHLTNRVVWIHCRPLCVDRVAFDETQDAKRYQEHRKYKPRHLIPFNPPRRTDNTQRQRGYWVLTSGNWPGNQKAATMPPNAINQMV